MMEQMLKAIEALMTELRTVRDELLQQNARRIAEIELTPKQHLESLRKYWITQFNQGQEIKFCDAEGLTVHVEPGERYGKPGQWRVHRCQSEYHRRHEYVLEMLQVASMFPGN